MAEVTRRRQRPQTGEMSSALALEDTALRRMIQQLQQQVEEVAARIPSIPDSQEATAYNDDDVRTQIAEAQKELYRIRKDIELLEMRVPVAKWVQVTSIEDEYLVCGNYVPLQDTSSGTVYVAKANVMNDPTAVPDYEVGQILLAVRALHPTSIVTTGGLHVEWTDGTGGGMGVIVVPTYASLPTVSDGKIGYTLDKDYFYHRRGGVWRVAHYFTGATTPSGVGSIAGDSWWNGTSLFYYNGTAWKCYTHFVDEDV